MVYTILCVDDEPMFLDLVQSFLEKKFSYKVTGVRSPRDAFEQLRHGSFDLVISDYLMPGANGIDFLKAVKTEFPAIPFIIFTGRGREDVVIEAINNGAEGYLQKGGEPDAQFIELEHMMRTAIERRSTEKSLRESRQRIADIVNFLPDATMAIDLDGRVIVWNKAIEEMTGIRAGDMLGQGEYAYAVPFYNTRRPVLMDLVLHPDEEMGKQYPFIIRREKNLISEIFIPHMNGGTGAYLWFIASPLFDANGNVTGAIESIRDITERKKIENALAASELRYRGVVEDQTEFICRFLPDGTHVFVNEAYCRYFNRSRPQIIGEHFTPRIPREDREIVRRHFSSLTPDNPVGTVTHRIIMDDGQVRWQRWSDRAIFDEKGNVVEYQSVGRDFTEQTAIEEALKESEARYRNIVEDQTELISRFKPDGTQIFVNGAYCRYFGLERDEIIGKRFIPRLPKEDAAKMRQFISSLTPESPEGELEHRIIMPDGSVRWQQWSDRAIFDQSRNPVEYQSVGRDVTDRKNAEEALEQSNALLHQDETRLEILVRFYEMKAESLQDLLHFALEQGIAITGSQVGYLAFVNEDETILTMYAWSESAMTQCRIDSKPIEYEVGSTGLWGEAIRQRRPVITNDYEAPNCLKKGYPEGHVPITRHMNLPIFDGERIAMVAGVGNKPSNYTESDVRELSLLMNGLWNVIKSRNVEEELQRTNRKLQLLNSISRHDILNMLTALTGYLELSRDFTGNLEKMTEFIDKERSITKIIEGQLAFMREYQNIGIKKPVWQDINETVRRVAVMLPMRSIVVQYDKNDLEILADPLLEKVFFNLIEDSLNYGGDAMTTIRIASDITGQGCVVMYEDNGGGISAGDKDHLFELGYGKHTGFGLYFSREILQITGIRIQETGSPGSGARFEIRIPPGVWRLSGNSPEQPPVAPGVTR